MLKENVDTLTTTTTASSTVTAQTSSNLKSKGYNRNIKLFSLNFLFFPKVKDFDFKNSKLKVFQPFRGNKLVSFFYL
jgi:hypothetical protein